MNLTLKIIHKTKKTNKLYYSRYDPKMSKLQSTITIVLINEPNEDLPLCGYEDQLNDN